MGMSMEVKGKLRIGAYLNLLPAIAITIGSFLKVQEEKLI
jgi:hypothetical protein